MYYRDRRRSSLEPAQGDDTDSRYGHGASLSPPAERLPGRRAGTKEELVRSAGRAGGPSAGPDFQVLRSTGALPRRRPGPTQPHPIDRA